MSRTWLVSSSAIAALALLGAASMVLPARAADLFGTNVRPFFSAGPSIPIDFSDVSRGFGVGFGFEAEQSPRVSVLFRVEWHQMRGTIVRPYPYFPTLSNHEIATANWSLGARGYLGTHGPFRSYVDGGFGVRLATEGGQGIVPLSPTAANGASADREGLAMILRFGLSSARPSRPGFFLDSGVDLIFENPDRYGLVPVRLGVVFP